MKVSELRKLTSAELTQKAKEYVAELTKIKVALKSGELTPENVNKSRELKLANARIKTVLNEMRLMSVEK